MLKQDLEALGNGIFTSSLNFVYSFMELPSTKNLWWRLDKCITQIKSIPNLSKWQWWEGFNSNRTVTNCGPHLLSSKKFACNEGNTRRCKFVPWDKKILWSKKWQPAPYSCLENSMDRWTWWTIVHGDGKKLGTSEHAYMLLFPFRPKFFELIIENNNII